MRRFAKPFAAALAAWELASVTGYGAYAALAGIAGFLLMWLLDGLYRRRKPAAEGVDEPRADEIPPPSTPTPVTRTVSERTSVW